MPSRWRTTVTPSGRSTTGIAPDTFKNDSEVVLEGQLKGEIFHADRIIAKCPSKYEPKPGAATTTGHLLGFRSRSPEV